MAKTYIFPYCSSPKEEKRGARFKGIGIVIISVGINHMDIWSYHIFAQKR